MIGGVADTSARTVLTRPFAACCAFVLVLTGAAAAQGFDSYKKHVVDYGMPKDFPGNPHHDQLTCFYYRGLMVKQLTNEVEQGGVIPFVSPLRSGATGMRQGTFTDREGPRPPEWGGYFRGLVKGDLVFFDADDGEDGGMPFVVYDSRTQKKIFEDNAYYVWMWNKKLRPQPSPFNDIRVRTTDDPYASAHLPARAPLRVQHPQQGGRVLATARPETRTEDHCRPQVASVGRRTRQLATSAVAYPVETSLFPTPVTKTISGPVRCWPAD